jgi:hypothetical protein
VVSEARAGAQAMRIMRGPRGAEWRVIQTLGGLFTREVPLRGDLAKDILSATKSSRARRALHPTSFAAITAERKPDAERQLLAAASALTTRPYWCARGVEPMAKTRRGSRFARTVFRHAT